ncbi:hypothetical protein HBH43_179600, partial [Parastagonospora nodorum]
MVPTATLPHSRTSPTNATSTICAGSCRRPLNNVSLIAHHCCLCLPARVLRQALNSFGDYLISIAVLLSICITGIIGGG